MENRSSRETVAMPASLRRRRVSATATPRARQPHELARCRRRVGTTQRWPWDVRRRAPVVSFVATLGCQQENPSWLGAADSGVAPSGSTADTGSASTGDTETTVAASASGSGQGGDACGRPLELGATLRRLRGRVRSQSGMRWIRVRRLWARRARVPDKCVNPVRTSPTAAVATLLVFPTKYAPTPRASATKICAGPSGVDLQKSAAHCDACDTPCPDDRGVRQGKMQSVRYRRNVLRRQVRETRHQQSLRSLWRRVCGQGGLRRRRLHLRARRLPGLSLRSRPRRAAWFSRPGDSLVNLPRRAAWYFGAWFGCVGCCCGLAGFAG